MAHIPSHTDDKCNNSTAKWTIQLSRAQAQIQKRPTSNNTPLFSKVITQHRAENANN